MEDTSPHLLHWVLNWVVTFSGLLEDIDVSSNSIATMMANNRRMIHGLYLISTNCWCFYFSNDKPFAATNNICEGMYMRFVFTGWYIVTHFSRNFSTKTPSLQPPFQYAKTPISAPFKQTKPTHLRSHFSNETHRLQPSLQLPNITHFNGQSHPF